MEASRHRSFNDSINARPLRELDFDALIDRLTEQDLWRLLQDVIASEIELGDDTVRRLDDRMQGYLFLQEYVTNRAARIEFARSPRHMAYLRDAAGGRNVWMDDNEFTELVKQDDSVTLACFARSEQMKPHHLLYIERKLAAHPHGEDLLASSDDARITLKKSIERQGNSQALALMRLAKAGLEGSADVEAVAKQRIPGAIMPSNGEPRALWRTYQHLLSLDESSLRELLEAAGMSTLGLLKASRQATGSVH